MVKVIINFVCVLWKRIADSFTAVDIIDLFGWNKRFLSMGGAILSAGAVGFSGAPWSAVIAVGLLAGCFILLLAILYQVWKLGTAAPNKSPLEIEFEGTAPIRWEDEQHNVLQDQVRRKHYGINVHNMGNMDVEQVAVEVEKIEQIPDRANEIIPIPQMLGLRLRFKLNNATSQAFPVGFRDRVSVISHVDGMLMNEELRIASTQMYEFHHRNRRHRIHIKVTGAKVQPVKEIFTVWVDSGGLQMQRGTV